MITSRRLLLGSLATIGACLAGGVMLFQKEKSSARTDPLLTDPETENFVYRDGWIVRI